MFIRASLDVLGRLSRLNAASFVPTVDEETSSWGGVGGSQNPELSASGEGIVLLIIHS